MKLSRENKGIYVDGAYISENYLAATWRQLFDKNMDGTEILLLRSYYKTGNKKYLVGPLEKIFSDDDEAKYFRQLFKTISVSHKYAIEQWGYFEGDSLREYLVRLNNACWRLS